MQVPLLPAFPELQAVQGLPVPPKLPKQLVQYKEAGPPAFTDVYQCQFCPWFMAGKCGIVEGTVTPTAWCVMWFPRRPPFSYLLDKIEIPAIK